MTSKHTAFIQMPSVDFLQSPVIMLDELGCVMALNPAAQMMWGVTASHAYGSGLDHWFEHDDTLSKLLKHMSQRKSETCKGVLHLARLNVESDELIVQVVISLVTEAIEGQSKAFYCLECHPSGAYESATLDAQFHAQVHQHQMLMRQLAHEVKNPLGGIRGAAQLLQAELVDVAPDLVEYTEMMLSQVDRLKNLVDQFLVPYRKGMAQATSMNIHEACEAVHHLARAEFGDVIDWQRDYDVSVPDVRGVGDYLQQMLLNLVQNAAQSVLNECKVQPRVTLRTRVVRQTVVNQVMHSMMLELSVIDNGPGVAPEIANTLFLPMVSQREGGTGLGLSVAIQIAQQHGGTIEVNSRSGHTQMRVLLPLAGKV